MFELRRMGESSVNYLSCIITSKLNKYVLRGRMPREQKSGVFRRAWDSGQPSPDPAGQDARSQKLCAR